MDSFEDEGRNDSEPHVMRADELVQDGSRGEHGQLEAGHNEPEMTGNFNCSTSFARALKCLSPPGEKYSD